VSLQQRLDALPGEVRKGLRRGIEKESLRVRPDGRLATTPHPALLGSALTHPSITTDFSESQLELITGVHETADGCLKELTEIHQFVYRAIGNEVLWCASMPCRLPADDAIPIGRYGSSNVGRAKTVYRTGLAHRYGRRMQTISGIHYNFSLPGAGPSQVGRAPSGGSAQRFGGVVNPPEAGPSLVGNEAYFGLIRNFRRHSWLLLYLFGASPAVCSSFVAGRAHELQQLSEDTFYLPHATSLRMGKLGYQSDAQSSLAVSYNDLASYAASLQEALTKPYPPYEAIGIRKGDDYRQLATSLLQIENEFYGTIRPKRVIRPAERPLHALRERGVEYVEARLMDLDPFCPIGITEGTIRMLDVFLLHCLLQDSPPDTPQELAAIVGNKQRVAARGREPGLRLAKGSEEVSLAEWGREVLAECVPVAAALDAANETAVHREALATAVAALNDPAATPSARVLRTMARDHGNSYTRFVLTQSLAHRDAILQLPFAADVAERYAQLAEQSLIAQHGIEAADKLPFETYRQLYLAPVRLNE
jgi:glutamate--cysteine ligase